MTQPFAGGCACGAIRYECSAEPLRMVQCHCRDCQRTSGGAYVAVVIVHADAVKILKGELRFHPMPSSRGGNIHRGFCVDCGSPVLSKFDYAPQIVGIRAGSLDDPGWFRPDWDIWTCDAQPWDYMNPAVPKFAEYPPARKPKESEIPKIL
jgi:hypothetical protein